MKFSAIVTVLLIGIMCQGCVIVRYRTPEVRGSVVDAATKKPIVAVRVQNRKDSHIFCETSADGSFDLPAGHYWGLYWLVPGDFFVVAHLTFKASGYQNVTNDYLETYDVAPIVLNQPIELKRWP